MKKIIISLVAFVALAFVSIASAANISGTVYQGGPSLPVAGALVVYHDLTSGATASTRTNSYGNYTVYNAPAGHKVVLQGFKCLSGAEWTGWSSQFYVTTSNQWANITIWYQQNGCYTG